MDKIANLTHFNQTLNQLICAVLLMVHFKLNESQALETAGGTFLIAAKVHYPRHVVIVTVSLSSFQRMEVKQ